MKKNITKITWQYLAQAKDEGHQQAALFCWAREMQDFCPLLKLLFHIPNGGNRDIKAASAMKSQGVKKGVPDICWPIPVGIFHGLYIELKVGTNKTSQFQDFWLASLKHLGYACIVCYGVEEAQAAILQYWNGEFKNV
jgi:hypothetical protein